MKEDESYVVIRRAIKSVVHIWANSWLLACMVLDLHVWFWICMCGFGFACMVLDLLAQYSQIYLGGFILAKPVMAQYEGLAGSS